MVEQERIVKALKEIGIEKGDKLLIHSSFKSLGPIEGGIETFIAALKQAVGEEGTLMFPTFTFGSVNAENPIFNIKTSPSCVGMIPEVFRHSEGVKRSLHPTHSLAVWGKDRDYYIENHYEDDNCLDVNSPIFKLKENGGKILLIGCSLGRNTMLHGVEVACKVPYAFGADYSKPEYHREYISIDEDGVAHKKEFFHVFSRASGYEHDFTRITEIVDIKPVKLLEADCYIFDAKELWDTVVKAFEKDPFCLARPMKTQ